MTSSKATSLKFSSEIEAPIEWVYSAFTTKAGWQEWFADMAEGGAKKMGYVFLMWKHGPGVSLQYETLKKNEQVAFTWHRKGDEKVTDVVASFKGDDEKTQVEIEHRGLDPNQLEEITKLWDDGLVTLKEVLETGRDPRIFKRPMIGINVGKQLTPELAQKKGYPVDHGIFLGGIINGMGADAAGLAKNDLMIEIAGQKIVDMGSISNAITAHTAGDEIEIVYYRGKDKHVAMLELSFMKMPIIPENAQDLSDRLGAIYRSANAKLDEAFEGASEEQAEYRRKAGEWNSKDVLAHLTLAERDAMSWASSLLSEWETHVYTSHSKIGIRSLRLTYPRIADLRTGLSQSQDGSLYFMAELPTEFVSRKSRFTRLASHYLLEAGPHYKEHIAQIQENLVAAQDVG